MTQQEIEELKQRLMKWALPETGPLSDQKLDVATLIEDHNDLTLCLSEAEAQWRISQEVVADQLEARKNAEEERDNLKALLRNVVSHASGGYTTGEGMSLNTICVIISQHHNQVYEAGKKAALGKGT